MLILLFVGGFVAARRRASHPDVAKRMHRSLDSVKNLWTRALARLRRTLGGAP